VGNGPSQIDEKGSEVIGWWQKGPCLRKKVGKEKVKEGRPRCGGNRQSKDDRLTKRDVRLGGE